MRAPKTYFNLFDFRVGIFVGLATHGARYCYMFRFLCTYYTYCSAKKADHQKLSMGASNH